MKTNCFAYRQDGCNVLKKLDCEGCNFYKTEKESLESSIYAIDIILAKDGATQNYINKTYYRGRIAKRRKDLVDRLNALLN